MGDGVMAWVKVVFFGEAIVIQWELHHAVVFSSEVGMRRPVSEVEKHSWHKGCHMLRGLPRKRGSHSGRGGGYNRWP